MAIFQLINESVAKPLRPATKSEQQWVKIGVEYQKEKRKGVTAKAFADERGINYATFTKSMSRYASRIKVALQVDDLGKKSPNKMTKQERQVLMINSFRTSIRDKLANEGAAVNNKSAKWFAETIKKNVRGHQVTKPMAGKLYAYIYDAKHKDTLPFWDKYPLIIYLGRGSGTTGHLMYGLNLHYIPPKARQQFLEELLKQYASTPTITNNTKLKIDWSSVKGFAGADKMIKAYIPGNIKGKLIEIKPSDWANVVMLPTQQFMSQGKRYSATKVWSS
ncbi:DNA end protector [Escherichia phage EcS1]|uniref:DNA end protector protein n=1 Tax=Escherichia phage EcS1 TaxID=2083276 RepID=A0A2Z5ZCK9_9CAUD|nr:DNA end protector [Escherichia phage EcS1]BBC78215.1 DNA end protector protein [Escherichia phage EcS1]